MDVRDGFTPYPEQGPFLQHVGPIHERRDGGDVVLGVRGEDRHANRHGTVMGGLLATFADFTLGRAIEADADDDAQRATVSLTIDYLKPAQPGDWIEARAHVDRIGGTLSFADCTLTVGDRVVARARAVFAA